MRVLEAIWTGDYATIKKKNYSNLSESCWRPIPYIGARSIFFGKQLSRARLLIAGLFAGQEGFKISRVGSGRIGSRGWSEKVTGRVRSSPAINGSIAGGAKQ